MRIEFDIAKRRLTVGGAEVAVEPLVFDLIVHLARHRDRVVSKPELVDEIWGGRIIAEATLSTALKSARRALGDDGRRQDFIETLQRRGLRYVGPPPVILGLGARPGGGGTAGRGRPSIAVLPLETLSSHASQQLLAVGLRQDLTQRLARTRWLFVSARGSAGRAVEAHSDPGEIAAALGVRYLLTGAAIASGGRARVSIELIEASNAERIWAETYERPLADLFAVQDEIADRVATAVEAEIEASERRIAELRPIGDLDAWSAYHRADALLHRFEASARAQAAGFLDAAAALDPGSARIAAARSFLSWQEAFFGPARDRDARLGEARRAAEEAVRLDPKEPQARWTLGRSRMLAGALEPALDELEAAVSLHPNFHKGRFSLGYARLFVGEAEAALDHARIARRLSPLDPMAFATLSLEGEALALGGAPEAGLVWARRAADQPNAHAHIQAVAAWIAAEAGEAEEARAALARARAKSPGYDASRFFAAYPYRGEARARIAAAFGRIGG